MNLYEMKKKVLGLIEELNPNSELLTDDPDISTKINDVTNQIMFELARMKKIPAYVEIEVEEGQIVTFEDIEREGGSVVYQIDTVKGECDIKAQGTVFKATQAGVLEFDYFKYPEQITATTKDKAYEFELSQDALEIMPYGIAGDLLKSDVSANFGSVYSNRYEGMVSRLDPRYMMASVTICGGVDI